MTTNANRCRCCAAELRHEVLDLGMSPPCESFLLEDQLDSMEPFFPLRLFVCNECWLVQLREYVSAREIFSEYAYFSSYSESWVSSARTYCEAMAGRFDLGANSCVVELASNDGYLLQHFVAMGVPVLGIEPATNVAEAAREKGVPTRVDFFGTDLARSLLEEGKLADLIVANNVLAQVPDLNDFVGGIKLLLAPHGVVTIEFPHLMKTIEGNQFDQVYHEHFSYFSLLTAEIIAARHDLLIFDVEELPTHGGSLRLFLCHAGEHARTVSDRVTSVRHIEQTRGYDDLAVYQAFGARVAATKRKLLSFLIEVKTSGQQIVGYGAPGKGNTLLNYCGIRQDFLDYLVDRNPYKHGRFTPGTHIPIFPPDKIDETRPDYVLILPWNLQGEIVRQMRHIADWGGRFLVPVPEVIVIDPREISA